MPVDEIRPVASATAFKANELIQLKRMGLAFKQQMDKVFSDLTHDSVQSPADYSKSSLDFGISTAEAEQLWGLCNGGIQSWNSSNLHTLVELIAD